MNVRIMVCIIFFFFIKILIFNFSISEIEDETQKSINELRERSANSDDYNNSATRDITSEISHVLDVLPYLGDGFVRKLLSRYDNSEQAISAVLENNLPPDLLNANQNEIYIPPDPQDTFRSQTGIERYNVFDGDEYDILTHDNPNCIIKKKKGFPGQPKNVNQLLDDKSHIKEMKERYQQYSLIEYNDDDNNEYEDEYDDSYDALAESESKTAKSKAINKDIIVDEIEDTESEEDDDNNYDDNQYGNNNNNENRNQREGNNDRDNSKDFCENPEIIRARYEASRNAKFANRKGFQQKKTDVVGKSKGQGQDNDVLFNRHKKEVHKSSRSNHNRKSGATWKRSRGMIPS